MTLTNRGKDSIYSSRRFDRPEEELHFFSPVLQKWVRAINYSAQVCDARSVAETDISWETLPDELHKAGGLENYLGLEVPPGGTHRADLKLADCFSFRWVWDEVHGQYRRTRYPPIFPANVDPVRLKWVLGDLGTYRDGERRRPGPAESNEVVVPASLLRRLGAVMK